MHLKFFLCDLCSLTPLFWLLYSIPYSQFSNPMLSLSLALPRLFSHHWSHPSLTQKNILSSFIKEFPLPFLKLTFLSSWISDFISCRSSTLSPLSAILTSHGPLSLSLQIFSLLFTLPKHVLTLQTSWVATYPSTFLHPHSYYSNNSLQSLSVSTSNSLFNHLETHVSQICSPHCSVPYQYLTSALVASVA